MLPKLMFILSVFFALMMGDRLHAATFDRNDPSFNRNRIIKFAVCQDFLVLLSIIKMLVLERCSVRGVARRLRDAGALTHLYLATVASLHGALLLDEPADRRPRLAPAAYTPPALRQMQDMMMAIEVVKYRMAPEYQPLTGARLWQLLSRASWGSRVFALSWVGAHVVLYREFTTSPPEYCKEAFKRPAWQ